MRCPACKKRTLARADEKEGLVLLGTYTRIAPDGKLFVRCSNKECKKETPVPGITASKPFVLALNKE